jgi:hypothetical protein
MTTLREVRALAAKFGFTVMKHARKEGYYSLSAGASNAPSLKRLMDLAASGQHVGTLDQLAKVLGDMKTNVSLTTVAICSPLCLTSFICRYIVVLHSYPFERSWEQFAPSPSRGCRNSQVLFRMITRPPTIAASSARAAVRVRRQVLQVNQPDVPLLAT